MSLLSFSSSHSGPLRRVFVFLGVCGLLGLSCPTWAQATTNASAKPTVLVLGDSLCAEYGIARGSGWVPLLQQALPQNRVINACISGDTTAGGKARLPALMQRFQPQVVIVALGANDGLRGSDLRMTSDNLRSMIQLAQKAKAQVLLLGMQIPPNYGPRYTQEFAEMFGTLAKAEKAALMPFYLKDVADSPQPLQWFLEDRIHPNAAAQPKIMRNVLAALRPIL